MVISFKDVSFSYGEKEEQTLKNINLDIAKGEVVLVCGASGCGKSTLLQIINGIIPEHKTGTLTGSVLINEKDAISVSAKEKSTEIGSVFQNPKTQFFHLNTTDELFFGTANHLLSLEEMEKRLCVIAKDFDIEHLINRNIFNLSGGEKQRIACASVAMTNPHIYVLDEPSSNLDAQSIEKLKNILAHLKSQGATIIIAEHRLYYALEICDKVVYMQNGEIQKAYTKADFLHIDDADRKAMGLRSFYQKPINELNFNASETADSLSVENVSVKYGSKIATTVEKLDIPLHTIVAIVGENGAGKTSFVRAFTGLHKTKKSLINGKKLKQKTQQKNSFMVMQDVNSQLYCESALDELIHLTDESDEIIAKAKTVLEKLNLLEFADDHPMVLSGGQKQRLAIATALFLNKKYLIFDEPTSGLDYDNMIRVSEVLKELKQHVDVILVITHDTELIENCAEHIIHFEKK